MTISGARYKPILMVRIKVSTNDKGGLSFCRILFWPDVFVGIVVDEGNEKRKASEKTFFFFNFRVNLITPTCYLHVYCQTHQKNETGSRSPCMRPSSDPRK